MNRHEALSRQGWIRQTTIDEPRLSEIVHLYEELGFEVHLEPVTSESVAVEHCSSCMAADLKRCKTVYTRKCPTDKGIE